MPGWSVYPVQLLNYASPQCFHGDLFKDLRLFSIFFIGIETVTQLGFSFLFSVTTHSLIHSDCLGGVFRTVHVQ